MPSSSTVNSSEKAKIKSQLPESSYKIITGTVARIYYAYPKRDQWAYSGLQGALLFVREKERGLFWFKLVDLTGTRGIIWEHEFCQGEFEYYKDRELFHSFAGDVSRFLSGTNRV
jgi:Wiskott-Aldrich syndrome protein